MNELVKRLKKDEIIRRSKRIDQSIDRLPLQDNRACDKNAWLVLRELHNLSISDINCKSWKCKRCRDKLRFKWTVIIDKGLENIQQVRFLTLTNCSNQVGFNNLVRDLRFRGYKFEYIKFNELTRKGLFHSHILFHGDYIPQAQISRIAKVNGLGGVVWVELIKSKKGIRQYVTKYVTKSAFPAGRRKFSYSKNFFSGKTASQIWKEYLFSKLPTNCGAVMISLEDLGDYSETINQVIKAVPAMSIAGTWKLF